MSNEQFLYLTTKGSKTGRQHRIEIWFVSYVDKYYIMSERREKAHWVQNIVHNSRIMFTVNSKSFQGSARIVDKHSESKLAEEVSSLMHTKYRWSDGLIVELTPHEKDQDIIGSVFCYSKTLQLYHSHHSLILIFANSIDNKYLLT